MIYAVVLRAHPEIVKIGRTTNWTGRRRWYDQWDFADDDGILECVAYCVTEEYTNLAALEAECLAVMRNRAAVRRGLEWFTASMAEARAVIEGTMAENGLSYIEI